MKFSERLGIIPPQVLQIDSISDELKNSIWNILVDTVLSSNSSRSWEQNYRSIYSEFLKWRVDELPSYFYYAREKIKNYFFKAQWFEIYNFLEFLVENEVFFRLPYPTSLIPLFNSRKGKFWIPICWKKNSSNYQFHGNRSYSTGGQCRGN